MEIEPSDMIVLPGESLAKSLVKLTAVEHTSVPLAAPRIGTPRTPHVLASVVLHVSAPVVVR